MPVVVVAVAVRRGEEQRKGQEPDRTQERRAVADPPALQVMPLWRLQSVVLVVGRSLFLFTFSVSAFSVRLKQ